MIFQSVRMRRAPAARLALAGLAAAALTWTLTTSDGQVAAAQFLGQFRSQKLSVVTIDPAQARLRLPELDALGSAEGLARQRPQQFDSVAEAAQRLGGPLHQPEAATLPAGIDPKPRIAVAAASQVRYTFNRDRARAYFDAQGRPESVLPDRLHGASLTVTIPAIAMLEYSAATPGVTDASPSQERAAPVSNRLGLMLAQGGEISVNAEGSASLEEMRDYFLTLPSLTESTARQLRSIQDWRNTLPIPVPMDAMKWQSITVSGNPGYLLSENAGLGSAVIWNANGRVYGLMGGLNASEIQRIANSVH